MLEIGLDVPKQRHWPILWTKRRQVADEIRFSRSSFARPFTLGGTGGGLPTTWRSSSDLAKRGLREQPDQRDS